MKKEDIKIKLRDLLRDIFQFDSEDLDFGIYKIMNYKRKEIEQFINKELIDKINEQLKLLNEEERGKAGDELEKLKNQIMDSFGDDAFHNGKLKKEFANTPLGKKYLKQKEQLDGIKISEELESKIYNHIFSFFSRYYDRGDFISKRRYGRKDKYVVPYSGEEVLLHWVNRDQYYVKTTECFSRYTFKAKNVTVNFRVVEAQEEKSNIKAPEKKFFVLNRDKAKISGNEINVYFEFRGLTDNESKKFGERAKQEEINKQIYEVLKERLENESKAVPLFDKEGDKTVLEKHLNKYTRRNTSDYFIHKNLKEFLEGELDYYIKNEVLNLEDLRRLGKEKVAPYLLEAQVIRNISLKIIEFLAQIENFQKKIWEKKKFIIKSDYVITIDKIEEYTNEEFLKTVLDRILKNKKQKKEWKELFSVDINSKKDLIGRERKLFEKKYKKLPIDTKYFDEEFKWKLIIALSEKNNLDEILDGVLIKSENWQGLNLLVNKYREKIKCIYIDPPYNTGSDEFLYRDNYQHSSWMTMMENRLSLSKNHMEKSGVIFVSIDDNEMYNLKKLMNQVYGGNFIGLIVARTNPRGRTLDKFLAKTHEYLVVFGTSLDRDVIYQIKKSEEKISEYKNIDEKGRRYRLLELRNRNPMFNRKNRPNLFYPIYANPKTLEVSLKRDKEFNIEVFPRNIRREDGCWTWSREKVDQNLKILVAKKVSSGAWRIHRKDYLIKEGGGTASTKEKSVWIEKNINNENGKEMVRNLFGTHVYDFPKSVDYIKKMIELGTLKSHLILDFFAGSGTTSHAVMNLNKEDGGKRKFVLIEMAEYFDTIIIPRMKKVSYCFNWREGKPKDTDGLGIFFKYQNLEQYEDSLENIEFEQKKLEEYKDYFVKYMLDFETQNSKTFLNIEGMEDPFNYKLKIIENYEPKVINVDLVETFNYLIGLSINKYKIINENGRKYVFVHGERNGAKALVVWRKIKDINFKKDKEIIEKVKKDFVPDETYINGDCGVKNFRQIETEFKSLMW